MEQQSLRKDKKYVINDFARFPLTREVYELDLPTKESALKVAPGVVCLRSHSGDKLLFICCGIFMECESRFNTYSAAILTSATLLQCPSGAANVAKDIKIDVYMIGGKVAQGQVVAVDFHYNIAIVRINSDAPVSIPIVRLVDDTIEIDAKVSPLLSDQDSSTCSNRFKLRVGDKVLALARFFRDPYDIMVVPGEFSSGGCDFDCKELLKADCKIKKNGIGGPLLNCYGEVIGINFYDPSYTPFLPMNIVLKCFEELKKYGRVPHTWLGVVVSDLYAASLQKLEILHNKFPHVVKGAIVEEVQPDSPADIAGVCANDVIISCARTSVGSRLELTEILWEMDGKPVELAVARASTGKELNLFAKAVKINPKLSQWPVPKRRVVRCGPFSTVQF